MCVNGGVIAQKLQQELKRRVVALARTPAVHVLVLQSDRVTRQFIKKKVEVGSAIGVEVIVERSQSEITTDVLVERINNAVSTSDGLVIQLPLPDAINSDRVFAALPASHDVDVLGNEARQRFEDGKSPVLPPVVAAMREILKHHGVEVQGRRIAVVGEGRLVGRPAAVWFARQGGSVTTTNKDTQDLGGVTKTADIIVLGAGSPGLLTPDMVNDGVVILDAGTSETGGKVLGDADPACEAKASLFTPTPGGIGPVAVTMIFANVLALIEERS